MNNATYDVVIAGAGPVGLLLANLLGRRGISCFLAEKRTAEPDWSRAIGVTPPSLAILKETGLHEQFIEGGVHVRHAYVHDDSGTAGRVNFHNIDPEFDYILAIPQSENMRILEDGLESCDNVVFRRGLTLTDADDQRDSVNAAFVEKASGQPMHVTAKWLIGCDGCDSTVRALSGIRHSRTAYASTFVMADYEDTTDWQDDAHLFFTRKGSLESFPLPGNARRWIALNNKQQNGADADFLESQVMRLSGENVQAKRRSPVFRFVPERLIVETFYRRRIILAGDAAHVISPIGGQGMNTGFADAEYLANIIPELLNDETSATRLLHAYTFCRKRAAGYSRRRAASGMWIGTRTGPFLSALRSLLFRRLLLKTPLSKRLPAYFAMLTIPYNRYHAGQRKAENESGG